MRIFFSGPLNDLKDPETTKAFYRRLADVAKANGFDYFWAFLNGTDPVLNPDVPPQEVYRRDTQQLSQSNVMVAYVGEPSTGTGVEIEYANRGCPAVKKELVFTDFDDAVRQFDAFLKTIKKYQ